MHDKSYKLIGLDKSGYQVNNFLISRRKHMLWAFTTYVFFEKSEKYRYFLVVKKRLIKSYANCKLTSITATLIFDLTVNRSKSAKKNQKLNR